MELFSAQAQAYRDEVLIPGIPVVSVEAGIAQGWQAWAQRSVSIECFGASAPGPEAMAKLGITPQAVVEAVTSLL
jgi:transketolase